MSPANTFKEIDNARISPMTKRVLYDKHDIELQFNRHIISRIEYLSAVLSSVLEKKNIQYVSVSEMSKDFGELSPLLLWNSNKLTYRVMKQSYDCRGNLIPKINENRQIEKLDEHGIHVRIRFATSRSRFFVIPYCVLAYSDRQVASKLRQILRRKNK